MAETPIAIETGGTNGIGQAITLTLAERGYAVIAVGNDSQQGAMVPRVTLAVGTIQAQMVMTGRISPT